MELTSKYAWTVSKIYNVEPEFEKLSQEQQEAFLSISSPSIKWLTTEDLSDPVLVAEWKSYITLQRAKIIADIDYELYKHIALARKNQFDNLGGVVTLCRTICIPSLAEISPDDVTDDYDEEENDDMTEE